MPNTYTSKGHSRLQDLMLMGSHLADPKEIGTENTIYLIYITFVFMYLFVLKTV